MSESASVHRAEAVIESPSIGSASPPAVVTGRHPRPRRAFDQPRFLAVFTALVFFYLFAPIVVVFLFSFNSKRST